jgi:hypothetical protein
MENPSVSKFTTRVELHDADSDDYTKLHSEMERKGFARTITVDDKTYRLPTAEYNYEGNETRDQVRDKAEEAARKVKSRFGILVTESNGRCWLGLTTV